jgi:hypothetical protein
MVELSSLDSDKIRELIAAVCGTQGVLRDLCGNLYRREPSRYVPVSVRTIQRIAAGHGNLKEATLDTVLTALHTSRALVTRAHGEPGSPSATLKSGELDAIALVLRIAVAQALERGTRVLSRPFLAGDVQTSPHKVTDRSSLDDPTEAIDAVARAAIFEVLKVAFDEPSHPLSAGCLVISEERGVVTDFVGAQPPQFIVWVDECDDTRHAKRGLGGTSLASVYHRSLGWCVTVVGDFVRRTLYWRIAGQAAHALKLPALGDGDREIPMRPAALRDPQGWVKPLRSSGVRTLREASLNLNLDPLVKTLRPEEAGVRAVRGA